MPGTRPGMTSFAEMSHSISCILSQTLRSAPLRASRRMAASPCVVSILRDACFASSSEPYRKCSQLFQTLSNSLK
jgi:hypothetical protein